MLARRTSRFVFLGVFAVALAGAAPANADPVYADTSVTIPVHKASNGQFTGSPQIDVAFVNNGTVGASSLYTVDTGSTGVIVDQQDWNPVAAGATKLGPGSTYYSSSHLEFTGTWYAATLQIGDAQQNVTAKVPVLSVTTQLKCDPAPPNCTVESTNPTISYFGVGFAREASSQAVGPNGQVAMTPADNPLLNVVAVNGAPVTASTPLQPGSSMVTGNYTTGYILSPQGLTLGLTQANTAGLALGPQLTWNDETQNSSFNGGYADWGPVPATLTVNGKAGVGTVLTDTGIGYMFVSPQPGASVKTDNNCPGTDCLAPGTTVSVQIGSAASYSFTIGNNDGAPAPGSPPAAPAWAQLTDDHSVFVNTGYHFFNQYEYMYDYANGDVGYLSLNPSSPEPSTWAMMLLGFAGLGFAGYRARKAPSISA